MSCGYKCGKSIFGSRYSRRWECVFYFLGWRRLVRLERSEVEVNGRGSLIDGGLYVVEF